MAAQSTFSNIRTISRMTRRAVQRRPILERNRERGQLQATADPTGFSESRSRSRGAPQVLSFGLRDPSPPGTFRQLWPSAGSIPATSTRPHR